MPERYPDVEKQPRFPDIERSIIETWRAERTFERSVERHPRGDGEFVFYDGPPFANGLPHYGHLLTGFVKDAVPRYQTMRGHRVERRFGWDCHGLPAEMEAERRVGVSGRLAIYDYGVERFNDECRMLVSGTADDWAQYVSRQARWVDMANAYRTMDLDYMESVMWAQKQLYEKGLLYEGQRVLPYCWECETPLSNFETRMDDAYRDRQDPAVTVLFTLDTGEKMLVWTTTPWTLPSNLALAVGPDVDYAVYEEDGQRYILGAATAAKYEHELARATLVDTVPGRTLVGRRYTPLFPYFADAENSFVVLAADWVATDEGTGVVHLAPGFGEDDKATGDAAGIPTISPVDDHGRFTAEVPDYAGVQVFEANGPIIRDLKERGQLVRHDSYVHSYPHCWRTDTPLIYKAVSSWFVKVTAIRDRMLELNQEITWVPEHVRDGSFGKWLEGARDWSISRNRFWGSPIPVWKSDDPNYPRIDVYGSLDELERDFGVRPTDLHRPGIDELTRPNPDDPTGRSRMRRIEDVLDCWFESGAMPFAQVHYPFENVDWFESHFPGDFICEYIGQTRGWFYTLHVLSTALFDKPSFQTCVVHGVLLGDDKQKLSKRLRNYPDPVEVFDTIGSDAMRWALLSSAAVRGGDMVADKRSMEEAVRQILMPIWNAWYFLSLYANAAGVHGSIVDGAPDAPLAVSADFGLANAAHAGGGSIMHVLDRYALAKVRELRDDVTARMDAYDISGACASILAFIDSLNNWYVRRSRDRFWAGDQAAVDTLHTVLVLLCRIAAPLLPLTTEAVYRGLTDSDRAGAEGAVGEAEIGRDREGVAESVHLTDWPDEREAPADPELVAAMDAVRDVCSVVASVRKAEGRPNRQPLRHLMVSGPNAAQLAPYVDLIADETNVRTVELQEQSSVTRTLKLRPQVLGPRVGGDVQKMLQAARDGDYEISSERVTVLGRTLEPDEYELVVQADEPGRRVVPNTSLVVALDLALDDELIAEGVARFLVRQVNELRKGDGLHVSDRIHLAVDVGHHHDVRAALEAHRDWFTREVLATSLVFSDHPLNDPHRVELPDRRAIHLTLHAASS